MLLALPLLSGKALGLRFTRHPISWSSWSTTCVGTTSRSPGILLSRHRTSIAWRVEGVRFRNAFATTPLCSPSRASFLTGLYPHAHGIIDNTDRSAASHQLSTFPRQLQRGGYETAFLGKWHMGNDDSPRPGFDYWVSMKGQGEAMDPYLNEAGVFKKVPGYITDLLTDRVVAFIERPRTRPFLVYLAHKALHPNMVQRDDGSVSAIGEGGFIPAQRHRQLYAGATIPRSPSALQPPDGKPALQRPIANLPPLGARDRHE